MRKYIFTTLFVCVGLMAAAQGNLQFNKVINFKRGVSATNAAGIGYSDTLTVPVGKVWKIENSTWNILSQGQWCNTPNGGLQIDGWLVPAFTEKMPIWLPEGAKLSFYLRTGGSFGGGTCSSYYGHFFSSIIEFNIQ